MSTTVNSIHRYRVQARSIEKGITTYHEGSFSYVLREYKRLKRVYASDWGYYDHGKPVPMLIVIGRI